MYVYMTQDNVVDRKARNAMHTMWTGLECRCMRRSHITNE